jgi:Skp family chaperone for outer membrane proteins
MLITINTIIAAVAAAAACAAVYFAWRTVRETQVARREAEVDRKAAEVDRKHADADRQLAERDRQLAHAARQRAEEDRKQEERDRQRRRIERVGELVEEVFSAADSGSGTMRAYHNARNRLSQALVGLRAELPQCVAIQTMHQLEPARSAAALARIEVEKALQLLHETETRNG